MGVKEAFIEKIEHRLDRLMLDIETLKTRVEETGQGSESDWLDDLHVLQSKSKAVDHALKAMRDMRHPQGIHEQKRQIDIMINELESYLAQTSQKFLGQDHPHPRW